jgi:hypothetical protein
MRLVDGTAFAARLRKAMEDAGIGTAAELERRWVDRFGGNPSNVHRQVMRLLNHTETTRPVTAERLAELTGKPAGYFTNGQPERRQSRLSTLESRLEELSKLAVSNVATLQELRLATEDHDTLIRSGLQSLEDLRAAYETRLEQLESQLQQLAQK